MSDEVDLRAEARPVLKLRPGSSVAAAVQAAGPDRPDFVVVADDSGVKGLLDWDTLEKAGDGDQTAEALLEKAPPPTVAEATDAPLSLDGVEALARIVSDTAAPGVVVLDGPDVLGVVSRMDLAARVARDSAFRGERGDAADLPYIGFTCETCGSSRFPRVADPPPHCPTDVLHGPMKRS